MIGKKIKLNDYQLKFGKGIIYLNVYAAFSDIKGNKFIIYSYDNTTVCFGNYFFRNEEAIVMKFKKDESNTVKDFINTILKNLENSKYNIISLDNIKSIEIIEEHKLNSIDIDLKKLYELTIPKETNEVKVEISKKEKNYFLKICIIVILFVIVIFLIVNPKILKGKNSYYVCKKNFTLETMPTNVNDEISLTFNNKNKIIDINEKTNYKFTNEKYFDKFIKRNYYYKYMNEGDSYKIDEENQTFKLFSNIDTEDDFFLPKNKDELIKYYQNEKYVCKEVDKDE